MPAMEARFHERNDRQVDVDLGPQWSFSLRR
jgi:hypothetical protein